VSQDNFVIQKIVSNAHGLTASFIMNSSADFDDDVAGNDRLIVPGSVGTGGSGSSESELDVYVHDENKFDVRRLRSAHSNKLSVIQDVAVECSEQKTENV